VRNRNQDQLQSLLARRTSSAIDHVMRGDGSLAKEDLDSLEQLARLIEIRNVADSAGPRRAWPIASMLAGTLLIVSVLLFARVRETEIELEVNATEVRFGLPSRQVLFEGVNLMALGVAGLKGIRFPEEYEQDLSNQTIADGEDSALRLEAVQSGLRAGSISIGSIVPAAGTDVWLRRGDLPKQYRLSLRNPQVTIQIDVAGPIRVSRAGVSTKTFDIAAPRAIFLEPGNGVVDVDLVFLDPERSGMKPQVPVRGLIFFRIDEFADRGVSIVRRLSTITAGTLYFESLNGAAHPLRAGEALRFGQATGQIRTIRLDGERLSVNFHGRVRGMETGSEDSPRSLMPTWLEWLKARHGLSLLWGTTLYLFGLVLGVARWIRIPL
jgi:hypothetical protein